MIAVPSIFTVAPRGIVNDDIFLSTPISSRVCILIGTVAEDDAVENQKVITGAYFFINLNGFTLTNAASKTMYTINNWTTSDPSTDPM